MRKLLIATTLTLLLASCTTIPAGAQQCCRQPVYRSAPVVRVVGQHTEYRSVEIRPGCYQRWMFRCVDYSNGDHVCSPVAPA